MSHVMSPKLVSAAHGFCLCVMLLFASCCMIELLFIRQCAMVAMTATTTMMMMIATAMTKTTIRSDVGQQGDDEEHNGCINLSNDGANDDSRQQRWWQQ